MDYSRANPPPPEPPRTERTAEEVARLKEAARRSIERTEALPRHRWSGLGSAVCLDCGKAWYLAIEHDACAVRIKAENDASK